MNAVVNTERVSATDFSMRKPLYLDYAATSPPAPEVVSTMIRALGQGGLTGQYANPGSRSHIYGWQAEAEVERARSNLAKLLGADVREIYFTSGATESNNIVLQGVVQRAIGNGKSYADCHLVSSCLEHKAVLDPLKALAKRGVQVTLLSPNAAGEICAEAVEAALTERTLLVSLMHVNNELGTLTDLASISALCRDAGALLHSDCAQSLARFDGSACEQGVDLASYSAHKIYGPKGIGALYMRRSAQNDLTPVLQGGGQERGIRPGTSAVHQLVGFGSAAELLLEQRKSDIGHLADCENAFLASLRGSLPAEAFIVNAENARRVPGIVNVRFANYSGEELVARLQGLAISTGSACTSASIEPSHVLQGLGLSRHEADRCIRFSFGRYTTVEQANNAGVFVAEKLGDVNSK